MLGLFTTLTFLLLFSVNVNCTWMLDSVLHLSPWAAITEYNRMGGVNNRNLFSQFWRLEVQATSSCQGWFLVRFSSQLADYNHCVLT